MTQRLPVVVLISGRGTNMRALADAAARSDIPIELRAVVSDRTDAAGLQLARERGIATQVLSPRDFPSRESFDRALADRIEALSPGLVVLAGYMRILSPEFVHRFAGRLINIHPSLLPKYPGLHTHRRALEAQDTEHGASVHYVTEDLDAGPVIIRGRVPVLSNDTEASLAARVQCVEHIIYPKAVDWIARGRMILRDGRAWLDGNILTKPPMMEDIDHAAT